MALIKDYYGKRFDITKENCYWKIDVMNGIEGGKELLRCFMRCFLNKTVADTNSNDYGSFYFEFVPDLESIDNFIKQAYEHAKTLPEFSGAIDA